MNEITFIYGLFDPRDGALRYVGQTIETQKRLREHIRISDGTPKSEWITEVLGCGLRPKLIVLNEVPREEADLCETETIDRYRELGCQLLNIQRNGMAIILSRHKSKAKEPDLSTASYFLQPDMATRLDVLVQTLKTKAIVGQALEAWVCLEYRNHNVAAQRFGITSHGVRKKIKKYFASS